jgi:phosphopantothenoylcysteine decarboxylase
VIGFSAPPVLQLGGFLQVLRTRGWDSYVILSPTAATWVDLHSLTNISQHPVRVEPRTPKEQNPLPQAAAVFVAPLTFNSLNKWAAGIGDTLALGILNESLGLNVPIAAAPCINDALQRHPAYAESVDRLTSAGVVVIDPSEITEATRSTGVDWPKVFASAERM